MRKLLLFVLIVALNSCSKNETPVVPVTIIYPEENPFLGYMNTSGFSQSTTVFANLNDYEMGFSFKPTVKGNIIALTAKIPAINNSLRVTIWDKNTKKIARTETLDITTADTEITKAIPTLNLIKDNEYVISIQTNSWYKHEKTNTTDTTYPITSGNIDITGCYSFSGSTQSFPNIGWANFYRGDVSFKFQRTE